MMERPRVPAAETPVVVLGLLTCEAHNSFVLVHLDGRPYWECGRCHYRPDWRPTG